MREQILVINIGEVHGDTRIPTFALGLASEAFIRIK